MKRIWLAIMFMAMSGMYSYSQDGDLTVSEIMKIHPGNTIYEGIYRYTPPIFRHCRLDKPEALDQGHLKVTYEASIIVDTMSTTRYKDRMVVLIGDEWYCSYGEGIRKMNMWYALPLDCTEEEEDKYKLEEGYEEIIPSTVYRNLKEKKIINRAQIPEMKEIFFRYDEHQPAFQWRLGSETREIKGYQCQRAETSHAGRKWTVWFTPEIPVDCGLWKFSGLPGLILEARDSKDEYVFTLGGVEQISEPIYIYKTREKKMDREAFRKTERNLYEHPILYSQGAEGYLMFIDTQRNLTGKEIFTVDNFVYPYNPIELE